MRNTSGKILGFNGVNPYKLTANSLRKSTRIFLRKKQSNQYNNASSLGFIILRHVNSSITNTYWIKCYNSIRHFYPENNILIIDDNSDPEFLTHKILYKTNIINSEFTKRGEVLPYYYFLQNK